MRIFREGGVRPSGPTLKTIRSFFGKLRAETGWSYDELHKAYFVDRISLANLKDFLRTGGPDKPHIQTVRAYREAYEQARAEQHPDYTMYRLKLDRLKRPEPSDGELALYTGRYDTWRFTRTGLVRGTLRIGRHPDSRVPYHWQEHQDVVSPRSTQPRKFEYEGPIYLLAANVHLSAIGDGYFRNTKCRRIHDPRKREWVGMYLSEEFRTSDPFAVKVLLLHEEWLKIHSEKVTDVWVRSLLRNGAPRNKSGGQDRLGM